jgi:hypothetical protein
MMTETALLWAEEDARNIASTNAEERLQTVSEDRALGATAPNPFSSSAAQGSPPAPARAPSLQRLTSALTRAHTMNRSFLATPLGLGAALVPSGPSLGSARSVFSFVAAASKLSTTGRGAAATGAAAEGPDCEGRHHVAFAAGLAAATSAAAAVSQAASIAASGVAAATSASAAASLALELGGKALAAGGAVLVDKVQVRRGLLPATASRTPPIHPTSFQAARYITAAHGGGGGGMSSLPLWLVAPGEGTSSWSEGRGLVVAGRSSGGCGQGGPTQPMRGLKRERCRGVGP